MKSFRGYISGRDWTASNHYSGQRRFIHEGPTRSHAQLAEIVTLPPYLTSFPIGTRVTNAELEGVGTILTTPYPGFGGDWYQQVKFDSKGVTQSMPVAGLKAVPPAMRFQRDSGAWYLNQREGPADRRGDCLTRRKKAQPVYHDLDRRRDYGRRGSISDRRSV